MNTTMCTKTVLSSNFEMLAYCATTHDPIEMKAWT